MAAGLRTAALLLIQGDADEEVAFDETIGCVRALRIDPVARTATMIGDELDFTGRGWHSGARAV